jgi:hypothetical protein
MNAFFILSFWNRVPVLLVHTGAVLWQIFTLDFTVLYVFYLATGMYKFSTGTVNNDKNVPVPL